MDEGRYHSSGAAQIIRRANGAAQIAITIAFNFLRYFNSIRYFHLIQSSRILFTISLSLLPQFSNCFEKPTRPSFEVHPCSHHSSWSELAFKDCSLNFSLCNSGHFVSGFLGICAAWSGSNDMCWLKIAGRFLALGCISGENSLQSVFAILWWSGILGRVFIWDFGGFALIRLSFCQGLQLECLCNVGHFVFGFSVIRAASWSGSKWHVLA